jgi:hypothetical protein
MKTFFKEVVNYMKGAISAIDSLRDDMKFTVQQFGFYVLSCFVISAIVTAFISKMFPNYGVMIYIPTYILYVILMGFFIGDIRVVAIEKNQKVKTIYMLNGFRRLIEMVSLIVIWLCKDYCRSEDYMIIAIMVFLIIISALYFISDWKEMKLRL